MPPGPISVTVVPFSGIASLPKIADDHSRISLASIRV
jgi:hypothetical protein